MGTPKILTPTEIARKSVTGNPIYVTVWTQGGQYSVKLDILKSDKTTRSVSQSCVVYRNSAMQRGIGNAFAFLNSVCQYKDIFGRYVINDQQVELFKNRIDAANLEIQEEAQDFVDNIDERKESFAAELLTVCKLNKCKGKSNTIIKKAMRKFPTKLQIMSGKIGYTIDTDGVTYSQLADNVKQMVDESQTAQAHYNRTKHLASRLVPVIECLARFKIQMAEKGKLHGATILSYSDACDILNSANTVEFNRPLPDISFFLTHAKKAVEDPNNFIDTFIAGLMHFAYHQGLIDELPYDLLDEIMCDRAEVELYGEDPNNNIQLLTKAVLADTQ